jgi:hypothetical protein
VNNSKTISVFVFLMAGTLLTTTAVTIVPAAYAGGDDHDDDNGDGNKNKAEEESAAAIADCDDNDVERAGFDCIAIASDVEIEPPEEESATLTVCKEVEGQPPNQELIPFHFEFIITGPGENSQVPGGPIGDPDPDCPPGSNQPGEVAPGEYVIMETDSSVIPDPDSIEVEGDCTQIDPPSEAFEAAATVEIQEGETGTLTCTFTNIYLDS